MRWRSSISLKADADGAGFSNDGRSLVGQMLAYDKHMNFVLAECEEFRTVKVFSIVHIIILYFLTCFFRERRPRPPPTSPLPRHNKNELLVLSFSEVKLLSPSLWKVLLQCKKRSPV